MSKPKTIKIKEVEYVRADSVKREYPKNGDASNPFMVVGKDYFIRTVTHYFTGRLVWVGDKEIALEDVAWIADTGRFNQFISGQTVSEVEPYEKGSIVLVGRSSIIDMSERNHGLLLVTK